MNLYEYIIYCFWLIRWNFLFKVVRWWLLAYSITDIVLSLQFYAYIFPKLELVKMKADFLNRNVNEGFSGGEKKRNEILQLAVWIYIYLSLSCVILTQMSYMGFRILVFWWKAEKEKTCVLSFCMWDLFLIIILSQCHHGFLLVILYFHDLVKQSWPD